MNRRIAKFEKVSYDQWVADMDSNGLAVCMEESQLRDVYNAIELPTRATKGSAGYDFKAPIGFTLYPGESIIIPTGIRALIDQEWCLICIPKSGLGFKYRIQLDNTVGLIDMDYYFSDNEGHIMAKITNDTHDNKTMTITRGNGFFQGVFLPFGITTDDEADGVRNGGFGSTEKR